MKIKKINIQLSSQLYKYFKSLLGLKHEKSGELEYRFDSSSSTYKLRLKDSVSTNQKSGVLDKVTPVVGDITYHTHPNIAYEKYNTQFGWPSTIDYVILLEQFKHMKCHIVVAKEGLWVICFHKDWISNRNKCNIEKVKEFIKTKWNEINTTVPSWCYQCTTLKTFDEYKNQINNVKYIKDGIEIKLFKIYLKKW